MRLGSAATGNVPGGSALNPDSETVALRGSTESQQFEPALPSGAVDRIRVAARI